MYLEDEKLDEPETITFEYKHTDKRRYVDADTHAKHMLRECFKSLRTIENIRDRQEILNMLKEKDIPLYDKWNYQPIQYYDGFQPDNEDGDETNYEPMSNGYGFEDEVVLTERKALRENLKNIISELLSELSLVEQQVITMNLYEQRTLKETGMVIGKAANRVQEIRERALRKLRKITVSNDIKDIIEELPSYNDTVYEVSGQKLPIAEYISFDCPCKLMEYLHKVFPDGATVCPGAYTLDGITLICDKNLFINNPDDIPDGYMTEEETSKVLRVGKNKIEQLKDIGRLPVDRKFKQKNIIGSRLVDCRNEVYFKADSCNKKYWGKKKQFIEQKKFRETNHDEYNCQTCENRCACIAKAKECKWNRAWPNSDLCISINREKLSKRKYKNVS